jgi:hypothetical protein
MNSIWIPDSYSKKILNSVSNSWRYSNSKLVSWARRLFKHGSFWPWEVLFLNEYNFEKAYL